MCPVCLETLALAIAGVTSTGAASIFLARHIALSMSNAKKQPEKERIRHEQESDRAPEGGLTS